MITAPPLNNHISPTSRVACKLRTVWCRLQSCIWKGHQIPARISRFHIKCVPVNKRTPVDLWRAVYTSISDAPRDDSGRSAPWTLLMIMLRERDICRPLTSWCGWWATIVFCGPTSQRNEFKIPRLFSISCDKCMRSSQGPRNGSHGKIWLNGRICSGTSGSELQYIWDLVFANWRWILLFR